MFLASFASALVAQVDSGSARHYFPANNAAGLFLTGSVEGHGDEILAGSNLNYHSGGSVILSAKAVFIFWGPSFASGGADNGYATTLQAVRNQFGTTPEFNVITQYYQNLGSGNQFIQLTNLGS
ncbi:MAG TPA: hypothetical protein VN970_05680, partial [Thermoanaerobaculia bacterium]|nr:hypothetical protein [Thermoanaerobaculia bacterium]